MTPRDTLAEAMTERALQGAVIHLARALGWKIAHFRPAIDRSGRWTTAMQGDTGYPDLTLIHPECGVVYAELKREKAKPTAAQREWLDAIARLRISRVKSYCWRPSDWLAGRVELVLRHGPAGSVGVPWWELDERFHPRVPA